MTDLSSGEVAASQAALRVAVDRLLARVRPAQRADPVFALVQLLADAAADAEGRPHRAVPRLDSDFVLPDQLRVMVADLVAAHPTDDVLRMAIAMVNSTANAL